jgi:hypothetical protein
VLGHVRAGGGVLQDWPRAPSRTARPAAAPLATALLHAMTASGWVAVQPQAPRPGLQRLLPASQYAWTGLGPCWGVAELGCARGLLCSAVQCQAMCTWAQGWGWGFGGGGGERRS